MRGQKAERGVGVLGRAVNKVCVRRVTRVDTKADRCSEANAEGGCSRARYDRERGRSTPQVNAQVCVYVRRSEIKLEEGCPGGEGAW